MIKNLLIILVLFDMVACAPPGKNQPGKPDPDNPPRMHGLLPHLFVS
ncbi:MAG TPA: hypothetical protein VK177_20875 [Flavobacteriales bacterium]|nr:hypothetical protein [Flavobacteriales bacterium]